MRNLTLVWLGGGFGAMLRYLLSGLAQQMTGATFPIGTLVVNVSGCFVAGVLSQMIDDRGSFPPHIRIFLFAGILGGFTTFSAFGNETINLVRQSQTASAGVNVAAHFIVCLGAVLAGRAVAALLTK